ncbi:MAG TPA: hypothetical protein PL070_19805 [Flavobacteriales bacterium]|nr:hypothetical protein [Flavobacteriales bacterium]
MKYLYVLVLLAFAGATPATAQQFEYLWIQTHGLDDNVVVVSSNGAVEFIQPIILDTDKDLKVSTASVAKKARTCMKAVTDKEAQGWSLFQVDQGVWILRRQL